MPKGKLNKPEIKIIQCQYCEQYFDFIKSGGGTRKSCYQCVPDGKAQDASLLRRLIKLKAVSIKGNKCFCCNQSFPQSVYDFHHLDPNKKDFGLGQKESTIKWDIVKKEIDKCIMVCANCHRMIHSGEIDLK